jgi:hypothetical protein
LTVANVFAELPAGAKLPALRKMPRYRPLDDEYSGLVFDPDAIRAKLAEAPIMYGTFESLRHARSGQWVIINRESKTTLIFRVVPLGPDGSLGKFDYKLWIERPLLAMCPNLLEHIKAVGIDRIRL